MKEKNRESFYVWKQQQKIKHLMILQTTDKQNDYYGFLYAYNDDDETF